MIIDNGKLKKYIVGAVYFEENNGLIPYRFTKQKIETARDKMNKIRHLTASGIKIDFQSDTESLKFNYTAFTEFSYEMYKNCFFDIYVNNELILHQGEKDTYTDVEGTISLRLKSGSKRITIYLPNSCAVKISDFTIDDNASMEKIKYNKNVMFFGDSITHTAYLDFPSLNYANILARRLNYNAVNQAIGGDIFDKNHLLYLPTFIPDTVYVAYGTNDWNNANESCRESAKEYFSELIKVYNGAQVNVILPIWRGDKDKYSELKYSFDEIRNIIKEVAESYSLKVIDGMDFVPHIEKLYYDGYLHPNEMGFLFYADSLERKITDII